MSQDEPIRLEPLTVPIHIRYTTEPIILPVDLREKVEAYWQERLHKNPHLFNGDQFTLTNREDTPEAIEIVMAPTKFATSLYSMNHDDMEEYAHKVFHSACLVITSDNKLVVGEMGKDTARGGSICCSGGSIDRGDIRGESIDLDYSTTHELQEELGIDPYGEHAISYKPAYIKTGGLNNITTVLYELRLDIDSKTLAANYEAFAAELAKNNEEIEFGQLFYVDNTPKAVERFIAEHGLALDAYIPALFRTVSANN